VQGIKAKTKNWEALKLLEPGTILHQQQLSEDAVFIVLRGMASLCAYLGVCKDHPIAGFSYNGLCEYLDVHGGLTFSGGGECLGLTGRYRDYYFYGWGYGHVGDMDFYRDMFEFTRQLKFDQHKWLPHEVVVDSQKAIQQFLRWKEREEKKWRR
jgi:hypothetical protein